MTKAYREKVQPNLMVDTDAIRREMRSRKITYNDLADELGVSRNTIINRIQFANWTLQEAYRVSDLLGLDLMGTFFAYPERIAS